MFSFPMSIELVVSLQLKETNKKRNKQTALFSEKECKEH